MDGSRLISKAKNVRRESMFDLFRFLFDFFNFVDLDFETLAPKQQQQQAHAQHYTHFCVGALNLN